MHSSWSTRPRLDRSISWLLVLVAGGLAYALTNAWIAYSDREAHRGPWLNFHPAMVLIYAPLAFGILWPVFIGSAAGIMRFAGQPRRWPAKTALILFVLSASCYSYFGVAEYRLFMRSQATIRAEQARAREIRRQERTQSPNALAVLEARGVDALTEPLGAAQVEAVKQYIDENPSDPYVLLMAARHYPRTVEIMQHLAEMKSCPPEVLAEVFDDAFHAEKYGVPLYQVYKDLSQNPNTPTEVLEKLLDNEYLTVQRAALDNPQLPKRAKAAYKQRKAMTDPAFGHQPQEQCAASAVCPVEELIALSQSDLRGARQRAALNPRLPKAAKIAYMKRVAMSADPIERIHIAGDPDCPPDVLRQLAMDPSTSFYAVSNPAIPEDLLEKLSRSPTPKIRAWAADALAKRRSRQP